MKKITTLILLFCISFSCFSSYAQTKTFSFSSPPSGSNFQFPGLYLGGLVQGTLRVSNDNLDPFSPSPFKVEQLTFNFESAPDITANNFSFDHNTGGYVAELSNKWVFRKINVEVLSFDLNSLSFVYRVSVVTNDDFVGSEQANSSFPSAVLLEGLGNLIDETPFKVVDSVVKTVEGKRLVLKLNGNLSSNSEPSLGMIGEGIEISMLWFGRGEKLAYLPFPLGVNSKPLGFVFEGFTSNNSTEYFFSIRYEENGIIQQTPSESLMPLLDSIFPPLF